MTHLSVEPNIRLLRQGAELIARLDDDVYAGAAGPGRRAAVGPHIRHCLDFYTCFLRDLEDGRVDYDRRERDPGVEGSRELALAAIESIVARLAPLGGVDPSRRIQVRSEATGVGEEPSAWHWSSVGRELKFLVSHTLHHYALVAFELRVRGIEPGEELGVAPSTLSHWAAARA